LKTLKKIKMLAYIGKCYCIESFIDDTGEVTFLKDRIYDLYDEHDDFYWVETDEIGTWRKNSPFRVIKIKLKKF